MVKTSILKILSYILVYFISFVGLYIFIIFAGLYNNNTSNYFKDNWNQAYVSNDTVSLSGLYKSFGDGVKQNKVDNCEKQGFYERDGNTYFCKDKNIIIFQKNTITKTLGLVFSIDYIIIITIISFISALILFFITYLKNKYTYYGLSRKGFTFNDIEKKYTEVFGILMEDIENINFTQSKIDAYIQVLQAYKLIGKGRFQGNVEKDIHIIQGKLYQNGLYDAYNPSMKVIKNLSRKYIINIYTILIFGTIMLLVLGINLNGLNWSGLFKTIDLSLIMKSLSKLTSFHIEDFNNIIQFIITKSILLSILIYERN